MMYEGAAEKAIDKISPLIPIAIVGFVLWKGNVISNWFAETLQLKDTPEEKEQSKAADDLSKQNYWNINFPKKGAMLITASSGKNLSDIIYNAMGYINDNEDKVYGVFRSLNYKTQVSSLSYWFFKYYSRDLYNFIRGYFNDAEMAELKKIIDSKPSGQS